MKTICLLFVCILYLYSNAELCVVTCGRYLASLAVFQEDVNKAKESLTNLKTSDNENNEEINHNKQVRKNHLVTQVR